jgi:hypothetical protein
VLEVIRETADDIIDQVHAIQARGRTTDDLILIELQIDIVEFVFCKQRHVFIEKVFGPSQGIEARSTIVRASSKLIRCLGEKDAKPDAAV